MSDDTTDKRRYTFTPENTSFDDNIAFMVFQDAPFEQNYDAYADQIMPLPRSIQHDGGEMFSTGSRVDPSYCTRIKEKFITSYTT